VASMNSEGGDVVLVVLPAQNEIQMLKPSLSLKCR